MVDPELFNPGTRIKLLAPTTVKARVAGTLLGHKANQYFLVDPEQPGRLMMGLEKGTIWTANFVSNGNIISFSTRVLSMIVRPTPLIFFAYPKTVEKTNLRLHPRVPVSLMASCRRAPSSRCAEGERFVGLIQDISLGGCQLSAPDPFRPGEILELTFVLPSQTQETALMVEVKRCQELDDRYVLGLGFAAGLACDGYIKVRSYVENLYTMALRF